MSRRPGFRPSDGSHADRLRRPFVESLGQEDGERPPAGPRLSLIVAVTAAVLLVAAAIGAFPYLRSLAPTPPPVSGALPSQPAPRSTAPPPPPAFPPVAAAPPVFFAPPAQANLATASPSPSPSPTANPYATPAMAGMRCSGAAYQPAGSVTMAWSSSSQRAIVRFYLSGLLASCQYAVGLFQMSCQNQSALLARFPATTSAANGTDTQTIASTDPLSRGIPAGSSLRVGPPGSTAAASAERFVACANAPAQIGG